MFKPVQIYYEKKSSKGHSKQNLYKKWLKLNDKKMRKFVKKAETKYDLAHEVIFFIISEVLIFYAINILIKIKKENPDLPLFYTFLNKKESELLFKSYGLPEKVPL